VIYLPTPWTRPNPTMQRCMMHADDSRALAHKSSTISSRVRIVRHSAPNSRPFSDACGVVDRDEVDRLRKRFMKLDKVRRDSLPGMRTQPYPFPQHRTTAARSNETNSSHYPKCPQILWQLGTSLLSRPCTSYVAIRSTSSP
jgi:hypothetical protein